MKVLEGRGQESNHSRSKQHQVWLKAPAEFSAESLGLLEHCAPARGQLTDYGMVDFSQGTCPRLNFFDGDLLLLLFVLLIYFLLKSWRRPLRQTKGGMPEQKTKVLDTKPKNRTPTWTRTLPCFPAGAVGQSSL